MDVAGIEPATCGSPKPCSALKSGAYGGSFLLGVMLHLSDAQHHAALSGSTTSPKNLLIRDKMAQFSISGPWGKRLAGSLESQNPLASRESCWRRNLCWYSVPAAAGRQNAASASILFPFMPRDRNGGAVRPEAVALE